MHRFFRGRTVVATTLILCVAVLTVELPAQAPPKPWTKDQIIRMLKGDIPPKRVETLARERGIDFPITSETETELRQAGATDALLATLRQLAPKPAAPVIPPPEQIETATVRLNPKDGLKYVWIPPGSFMMGCSQDDNECSGDEKPAHQVTITKGFWIGQTEATVVAYRKFVASTGAQMPAAPDFNAGWNYQDMPIVNVSWDDATAFCGWAGGRLPTEAEWEYAARAGSTEARYGRIDEVAWYPDNSGSKAHDVAQKRPNAWNLYDTLGNVWEWVNDWYGEKYYPASPERDPRGPDSGQGRVLRGGSWFNYPGVVRVSYRNWFYPAYRNGNLGVRCAREVE